MKKYRYSFIVVAMLLISIVVAFYVLQRKNSALAPVSYSDSACNGERNEYYDMGFGIEHGYDGEITPGKKVHIILSCDHTKLTISGVVDQVISPSSLKGYSYKDTGGEPVYFNDSSELADLANGTAVIDVDHDYNFDGYNDITTVASSGSGSEAIDSYFVFLYSPLLKKFEFNSDLSSLNNIYLDQNATSTKEVSQGFSLDEDGSLNYTYVWSADGKLYKKIADTCESNRQHDNTDVIKYYIKQYTEYMPDGVVASSTEAKVKSCE